PVPGCRSMARSETRCPIYEEGNMSKAQKKFQKKKDRERQSREKILARRQAIREKSSENHRINSEEHQTRTRNKPITNKEFYAARKLRDQEIKLQLEHNMQVLKALEEEYEAELKNENK